MNKTILVFSILILLLTACGTPASGSSDQPAVDGTPQPGIAVIPNEGTAQAGGFPRDIPPALKLALGTFKLDETDYAVDAEQAKQLLPLWKAARSLGESDTTAVEEIDALLKQIESTMTPEQMQAIDGMGLTFEDMRAILQGLGIEIGPGGRFGDLDPEARATAQAAIQSGQAPPGGFEGGGFSAGGPPGGGPGGGGPPGGGFMEGASPEVRQTAMAERGVPRGASLGLNSDLLDALIEFLQAKAQ
jgi:hypothetical protein